MKPSLLPRFSFRNQTVGPNASAQVLLVLFSAALMPFCFPPFGYWPLIFAVLPLLLLATTRTTDRRAFYFGLLHGTLSYGGTLAWLTTIFGAGAITLFAMFGVFTASFCWMANRWMRTPRPMWVSLLGIAVVWTAIEFFRSELFTLRFPWVTPGTAIGPTYLSSLIGVYGTSFLVAIAGAAWLWRKTWRVAGGCTLILLGLGVFRPGVIDPGADALVVTAVQGEEIALHNYVNLTKSQREKNPDLVIWPEYALPEPVRTDPMVFGILKDLCADMDITLVLGTRTIVGEGVRDWHNTAIVMNRDGVIDEYYKARPIHFFNDGIPGTNFTPIATELGTFSTPICFDCDYTAVVRRMAGLDTEFFAVPVFDAKRWTATEHLQHAALLRCRAAETGRWFASAASSGVSQIIDPNGNVQVDLATMKEGVITGRIERRQDRTWFVRAGWLFPWANLALFAFGLLFVACRRHPPTLET